MADLGRASLRPQSSSPCHMLFASSVFLYYFLPLFLAVYYLAPKTQRTLVIALASYVFYGWWRPDFVLLMLGSTVVDYWCGRAIVRGKAEEKPVRRYLLVSCVVNLGLLAYFKYANFGVDTLNSMLVANGGEPIVWTSVILPVGISFYTFQTLSYSIDLYRGQATAVRDFRDFMAYVALFPQLVAGPIVRYNTVAEQLHERTHTLRKFSAGVLAFQAGLAKKVLIADVLAPVADAAFAMTDPAWQDAWVGALAYTFQIYFDFSGYSDMAIGLGLMIGFRFPINFDQPYRSHSITEFWRRWHISLSSFLRDYLYLPLGGNRKSPLRTYVNLATVMLLGGLWHGAAWTFVAWGAYQGFWLILERAAGKRPLYASLPAPITMAITFVLVMGGWVLFRAPSMEAAWMYWQSMCGLGSHGASSLAIGSMELWAFGVAAVVVWACPTTQQLVPRAPVWWQLALQVLFLAALLHIQFQQHVPFLYFQF